MRIALIYHRHAADGGVERNLDALAKHLADQGHAVEILCRRHGAAPHPHVRFRLLRSFAIGALWRETAFARDVQRAVDDSAYDAVLAYGRTPRHDVIRLGMGCHATYLERMNITPGLRDRRTCAAEAVSLSPTAFRGTPCIIANSGLVARDAIARYALRPSAVQVIPNGADLDRFHPRLRSDAAALRAQHGIAADAPLALFLGSGFARKGLGVALAAFARLRDPRAALVVIGSDAQSAAWQSTAERLDLHARVRFLGVRSDVPAFCAAADVLFLPTFYDPFANATVEAIACGTPVLTSTSNGGAEILNPDCGIALNLGPEAPNNPIATTWFLGSAELDAMTTALGTWLERGRRAATREACRSQAERFSIRATLDATAASVTSTAV